MTDESQWTFDDLPESQRYKRLLEGESLAGVRLSQGLSSAGNVAGKAASKFRSKRKEAKERKATEEAIKFGQVKDISGGG